MWDGTLLTIANDLLMAQAENGGGDAPAPEATNPFGGQPMILMIVAMIAIMYFFMIRPQQKREKERREMLSALSKGDRVVTNGGIIGTIIGVNEKNVVLRVSDNPTVKMEFLRGAVSRIMESGEDSTEDSKE